MALLARFHPLLVHFPIALVNLCAGAPFAVLSAVAGWRPAPALGLDPTSILAWHRWLGTAGAGVTVVAALATLIARRESPRGLWMYRIAHE